MLLLSQQYIFAIMAVILVLDGVVSSGIWPISAAMAMGIAAGNKKKSGYGSIRLWGALGWAAVTYFGGVLIERTGIFSAFVGYAVVMVLSALIIQPLSAFQKNTEAEKQDRANPFAALTLVWRDRALGGFAIALLISWASRLGMRQFEVLFMDQLGAPESMIGLASTLGAIIEVPIMLWVDKLIRKYNTTRILRVGFFLEIVRVALVVFSPTIPTIFLNRAIGGVSFAFISIATVVFITERAPSGQNATYQALYSVTFPSLVTLLGAPLMGRIYDARGAYIMYPIAAIGISLSLIIFWLTVTGKRSQSVSETVDN